MTGPEDNEQQGPERSIRVFISSTFRDMHAEREELVKRVFPRLRKLCEDRGVGWCEVDLRWGVTQEQKGEVLNICLQEIDRCRPFFIGLLGERYGWVPERLEPAALEREPWLAQRAGHSITELEILHGVLNNPKMAGRALFYFRDPKYAERLGPGADRAAFLPENPESARKLEELKARIRTGGVPVREPYADARALGEFVLADMVRLIDEIFPAGAQPDALDREIAEHEAYLRSRLKVFVGRKGYLDAIDQYMDKPNPPLVMLGESGIGKSAILANWVARRRRSRPDEFILAHFVGSTAASTDWKGLARRIIGELGRRFGFRLEPPDEPAALSQALAGALHRAAAKGRFVLVLDGLDQLEDRDQAPDLVWLPPRLPENARLIASARPGRALTELGRRDCRGQPVSALSGAEREQVITDCLAQYRKALSPIQVRRIASAGQAGNPLFLRALLEELRVFGVHERLDEIIAYYLQAPDAENLYIRILARLEADYERDRPDLVRDAFSLLWAARRGLSEAELLDLLGSGGLLARAVWSPLFLAAEQSLVVRSGLISFFHDYLRRAVQARYLQDEARQRAARLRLADYFAKRDVGQRKVEELPWQLEGAGEWRRLSELLADDDFLYPAWIADRSDVRRYWSRIEAASEFRAVDAYGDVQRRRPETASLFGHVLFALAHFRESALIFKDVLRRFEQAHDLPNVQMALNGLIESASRLGERDELLELSERRAEITAGLGMVDEHLDALLGVAKRLVDRAQPRSVLAKLDRVESLSRRHGRGGELVGALRLRAGLLAKAREFDAALAALDEVERLCRRSADQDGLRRFLGDKAGILLMMGSLEPAAVMLAEQARICRDLGDRSGLAGVLQLEAMALDQLGRHDDAAPVIEESIALFRELGDKPGLMHAIGALALHRDKLGDLDGALRCATPCSTNWRAPP